jgi:hypothetical protein
MRFGFSREFERAPRAIVRNGRRERVGNVAARESICE